MYPFMEVYSNLVLVRFFGLDFKGVMKCHSLGADQTLNMDGYVKGFPGFSLNSSALSELVSYFMTPALWFKIIDS